VKYTPKLPEINDNISHESPLKELFVLLTGLLVIVVGVYILLGLAVNWVIPRISVETEQEIAGLFAGFTASADSRSPRALYIQGLADSLQETCADLPYDISVAIVDQKAANAAALPGGTILVFSGLLDTVTSENELAFILGHEFGHFANRDHLRGFGRAMVLVVLSVTVLGPDSGVGRFLAQTIGITETGFSREQETAADEYGAGVLNCRYGHVSGATDFFETMDKSDDPGMFGQYFTSHPEPRVRIDHIAAYGVRNGWRPGERISLPELFDGGEKDHVDGE
jgi:Zn-dependent protease with chaperone function